MGPQFQAQSPCTNSLCSGYFFFELSIRKCKINPAMFKNCNPAPVSAYSAIWKCSSHLTSPRHLAHGFGVWTPCAISCPPMNFMACSITWLSISIGPSTSDFPEICIISSKIVIIHSPRCGQWDPRASLAWAFAIAFFCCFSTYASVLVPCARMPFKLPKWQWTAKDGYNYKRAGIHRSCFDHDDLLILCDCCTSVYPYSSPWWTSTS